MTLKKSPWYYHNLPAIAYALQADSGALVLEKPDIRAALDNEITLAISESRDEIPDSEGEWLSQRIREIGSIIDAEDTDALYKIVEQSAFTERRQFFRRNDLKKRRASSKATSDTTVTQPRFAPRFPANGKALSHDDKEKIFEILNYPSRYAGTKEIGLFLYEWYLIEPLIKNIRNANTIEEAIEAARDFPFEDKEKALRVLDVKRLFEAFHGEGMRNDRKNNV